MALGREGGLKEAIIEYDEAIRLDPQNDDAYYKLADAYTHLNQLERAVQHYDEATRLNSLDADAYTNGGIAYSKIILKPADRLSKKWNCPCASIGAIGIHALNYEANTHSLHFDEHLIIFSQVTRVASIGW